MTRTTLGFLAGIVVAGSYAGLGLLQDEGKALEPTELKAMVTNLGYTTSDLVTDPAKLKFQFTVTRDGLDIPIAAEIAPSKRFIWLTAFLGESAKMTNFDSKATKLLQANATVQPTQFYLTTKGNVMIGLPIENRDLTPAMLRGRIDKLAGDVGSTQSSWGG